MSLPATPSDEPLARTSGNKPSLTNSGAVQGGLEVDEVTSLGTTSRGDQGAYCGRCGGRLGAGVSGQICPSCAFEAGFPPLDLAEVDLDLPRLVAGQLHFGGRYRLERELGRGGMGVVWLAWAEHLEQHVALKFLPSLFADDLVALNDLKREARRSLELTHHHIVRIHDLHLENDVAAISMEYVDGDSLRTLQRTRSMRCFEVEELKPWIAQLCVALEYAHERAKIAHRDLKPGNLLINRAGELKLADFGIAASLRESVFRLTRQPQGGTLPYMSPQQYAGELPTAADDIYSLGATIYELLTGQPPFHGKDYEALAAEVAEALPPRMTERRRELGISDLAPIPAAWEETVAACLQKVRAKRPQTACDVAESLSKVSKRALVNRSKVSRRAVSVCLLSAAFAALSLKHFDVQVVPQDVEEKLHSKEAEVGPTEVESKRPAGVERRAPQTERRFVQSILAKGTRVFIQEGETVKAVPNATGLPSGEFRIHRFDTYGSSAVITDQDTDLMIDCSQLASFAIHGGVMTRFPFAALHNLQSIEIRDSSIPSASFRDLPLCRKLEAFCIGSQNLDPEIVSIVARCPSIDRVGFATRNLKPEDFAPLASLKNLRGLIWEAALIKSDTGLEVLTRMPTLEDLGLDQLLLAEKDSTFFSRLTSVRLLRLWSAKLSHRGWKNVGAMPALRDLQVGGSNIADADLAMFSGNEVLEALNLHDTEATGSGFSSIQPMPNLRAVTIGTFSNSVTDEGVAALVKAAPSLQKLQLGGGQLTLHSVTALATAKSLEGLSIFDIKRFDRSWMPVLARIRNLSELCLRSSLVDDACIPDLAPLQGTLTQLDLAGAGISDRSVEFLVKFRNLRSLNVSETRVTADGRERIRKALPECDIL